MNKVLRTVAACLAWFTVAVAIASVWILYELSALNLRGLHVNFGEDPFKGFPKKDTHPGSLNDSYGDKKPIWLWDALIGRPFLALWLALLAALALLYARRFRKAKKVSRDESPSPG